MMKVSEIMSDNPMVLPSTATLAQAKAMMRSKKIRHIPIVEEGNLVGLITLKDLLAAEESSLLRIDTDKRDSYEQQVRVEEFMKQKLITVDENTSARQAALYLAKHKFGCLPVVQERKVVGIITDSDFVNVAINLLELADTQEVETNEW